MNISIQFNSAIAMLSESSTPKIYTPPKLTGKRTLFYKPENEREAYWDNAIHCYGIQNVSVFGVVSLGCERMKGRARLDFSTYLETSTSM